MKKLFLYYIALMLIASLAGGIQAQIAEFFERDFSRAVEGSVPEVADAAGANALENLSRTARTTVIDEELETGLMEDFNNKFKDLSPEDRALKLEEFQKQFGELGSILGKVETGPLGELTVGGQSIDDLMATLERDYGVDPARTGKIKTQAGGLTKIDVNKNLPPRPVGKGTTLSKEQADLRESQYTARKKMSDYLTERGKLSDLQSTREKLSAAGLSTEGIDKLIADQDIIVKEYGFGGAGTLKDWFGRAKGAADIAFDRTTTAFSTASKELRAAEGDLTAARGRVDPAAQDLIDKQGEFRKTSEELERAKQEVPLDQDKVSKLEDAKNTQQKAVKEAQDAYSKSLDEYTAANNKVIDQQTNIYKNRWRSNAQTMLDKAEAEYNLVKTTTTDPEELARAKSNFETARQQVAEEGGFWERTKLKTKGYVAEKLGFVFDTVIAGVLFMIPGTALQYYQEEKAKEALLNTMQKPQNFGGIWMQIPQELINKDDPLRSVFLYVGVQPGGDCSEDVLLAGESEKRCVVPINVDTQFFVSMGQSDFEGWATQPITSPQFSNKMVNLNTGYMFYGDGRPVNALAPAQRLLNTAVQKREVMEPQPASITDFLPKISSLLYGTISVETFNPASDIVGGLALGVEKPEPSGKATTIASPGIADVLATTKDGVDKTCSSDGKIIKPCADILQPTIAHILSKGLAWPAGAPEGATPVAAQTITNVWPIRALNTEELNRLVKIAGLNLIAAQGEDEILPLYGINVYETTFTELGKQLNVISGGDNEKGTKGAVADYVLPLDGAGNIVPMRVPKIQDGTVVIEPNDDVAMLYSLISEQTTTMDGTTGTLTIDFEGQPAWEAVKSSAWLGSQLAVVKKWYPGALKEGPFTVGGKTLTIDPALAAAGTFIYTLDPAQQSAGKTGTLEDGSIDYLVALDANRKPVDIGTNRGLINKFVSLVSSRFYDKDLKPSNAANGYPDTEFKVGQCGTDILVIIPPLPGACKELQLAGQPGPYKAPLHTLFMDADINPYNNPALLSFMLMLATNPDPTKSIGTAAASLIESAFEAAGVHDAMMQLSTVDRDALVQLVVANVQKMPSWPDFKKKMDALNAAIDAWKKAGSPRTGDVYTTVSNAQKDFNAAIPVLTGDLQKNGATAFAGLGDAFAQQYKALTDEFKIALNKVAGQLATSAPKVEKSPTSPANYVTQGRIPVPNQWALKLGGFIAATGLAAAQDKVNASYAAWKKKLTETYDQWSLYNDKGPFHITPETATVQVDIEATSVEDLRRGVYIYTSTTWPGEFFIVGSGVSDVLLGKRFDVLNKSATPYLLSLSSGKIYDVSVGDPKIVPPSDYTVKKPEELITALTTTWFKNLPTTDPLVKTIADSQNAWRARRAEQEFNHSFYRFNLFLDNRDADGGVFIYQDVTKIPDPKSFTDRDALMRQAKDFFVYLEFMPKEKIYHWNLEMPEHLNENSRIMSLVTGIIYNSKGPVGIYELYKEPGATDAATQTGVADDIMGLITNVAIQTVGSGAAIRKELRDAITALITQSVEESKRAIEEYETDRAEILKNQGYPELNLGTAADLVSAPFIPSYPALKFLNGKYYQTYTRQTTTATGEKVASATVLDYAVKSTQADLPEIGILYNVTYGADNVTPIATAIETELSGELLKIARATAGVIVADDTQTLTLPNEQYGLDVSKIKPMPNFASVATPAATYEYKLYDNRSVMLLITPTGTDAVGQKIPPYYLDLYSGVMFDQNGKPLSIAGYFSQNASDGRYLLVTRDVTTGLIDTLLYEGKDGVVLTYWIKATTNNPEPPQPTAGGDYMKTTYIMEAFFTPAEGRDAPDNLMLIEYSPLTDTGKAYYEVIRQTGVTYSESTENLYLDSPAERFDEKGHFNEIDYVLGADPKAISLPSNAYVLTMPGSTGEAAAEAIIWQDTKKSTSGILDLVVYRPGTNNFVANFDYLPDITPPTTTRTKGTATITYRGGLVVPEIQQAYGYIVYYNEITDVDNNHTYKFVDLLNVISQSRIRAITKALGTYLVSDYKGNPVLVSTLPITMVTMNASTLPGNVYQDPHDKRDVKGLLADRFALATVKKATDPADERRTRFLYQVGSWKGDNVYTAGDTLFKFYTTVGTGNYIDLETGVAYGIDPTTKLIIPKTVVSPSDLIILRSVVTHANVLFIPQCQLTYNCASGQEEPKKKVLTYYA